ncbi:MAG: cation transporter [Meiothermus sp.]|nr:cation transporter [Meiothermus sp.]
MQLAPQLNRLYVWAFWLSLFTIAYNLLEGSLSVWLGSSDESLTLFGFGLDSFVEVASGTGILLMVLRIWRSPQSPKHPFEQAALRITGYGFYALVGILSLMAFYNLFTQHKPEATLSGVVISLISLAFMWLLIDQKTKVGRQLGSAAILADANCAKVCMYMSAVLLASSAVFYLTGIWFVDSLGALGLAYFSFQEGREALAKANGAECDCHHH